MRDVVYKSTAKLAGVVGGAVLLFGSSSVAEAHTTLKVSKTAAAVVRMVTTPSRTTQINKLLLHQQKSNIRIEGYPTSWTPSVRCRLPKAVTSGTVFKCAVYFDEPGHKPLLNEGSLTVKVTKLKSSHSAFTFVDRASAVIVPYVQAFPPATTTTLPPPPPPPTTTTTTRPPGQTASYSCTGSAPEGVDITYGSDTDNLNGASNVPWQGSLVLPSSVEYADVSAQLQGPDGTITCTTTVTWTVNGISQSVTQTGTASGNYNIASAEICSDFSGGFETC
jgi:hypothetical protein